MGGVLTRVSNHFQVRYGTEINLVILDNLDEEQNVENMVLSAISVFILLHAL